MPLTILPGTAAVLFLLNLGTAVTSFTVEPARFLEGLRTAKNALSFASVDSVDHDLEELLPWCGNV
jgi:hypothetical protein